MRRGRRTGVSPDDYDLILRRGGRLDDGVDGSGLGLAIVNDIVSAYAGHVELSRSELGGLAIITTWPEPPVR